MKHRICPLCLILFLLLSVLPVSAAEPEADPVAFSAWSEGLDTIMAQYMEEHSLDENNFSMGYLYTGTGEYWYYNEEAMYIGGSTYKLPLNMRITEKVLEGTLSWDDYVRSVQLPYAQWLSIVNSNNPISQEMQHYLVGYSSNYYYKYRAEIAKYFTDDPSSLPSSYYSSGTFCTEYLLKTLVYLNEHEDIFSDLIGYMKEAAPDSYFRMYEDEYSIAHKYGYYSGYTHDMGIIYTPTPFLLVVMTNNVYNAEEMLGDLCRVMTEYTLSLDAKYEQERIEALAADIAEAAARAEIQEQQQAQAAEAERTEIQLVLAQSEAESIIREIAETAAFSSLRFLLPPK